MLQKNARSLLRWGRSVGGCQWNSQESESQGCPHCLSALQTQESAHVTLGIPKATDSSSLSEQKWKSIWNEEEKPLLDALSSPMPSTETLLLSLLAEGKSYRAQLQSHKREQRRINVQWINKLITCTTSIENTETFWFSLLTDDWVWEFYNGSRALLA